jgi:hypothetical protein
MSALFAIWAAEELRQQPESNRLGAAYPRGQSEQNLICVYGLLLTGEPNGHRTKKSLTTRYFCS